MLALLCLVAFVGYVLRTNLSIAAPALLKDLGLSELQLGLVFSANAWAYAMFQFPGGLLGRAFGARRAMALAALSWGVVTLLTGLVPGLPLLSVMRSLVLLVTLRFLLGAVQAPLFPITGASIGTWFPVSQWGAANGVDSAALTVGAAAVGPGVAWLVARVGWRQSFWVVAPLGFVMAALWWRGYRDDPAEHPAVNPAEVALIREGRPLVQPASTTRGWVTVLRRPAMLALTGSYFCMNYVFYLFFNWFYYYLVEIRGFSAQDGGWFTGAQWLVGGATAVLGGWLSDRCTRRWGPRLGHRLVIMGGLVLCGLLLVLGARVTEPLWSVALLSLSFGAAQLTDAPFWSAATRMGGNEVAAATGLMNTGGNLVGAFGGVLVPLIAARLGWDVAIMTGGLCAGLAALLWLWIRVEPPEAAAAVAPAGGGS